MSLSHEIPLLKRFAHFYKLQHMSIDGLSVGDGIASISFFLVYVSSG